MDIRADQEKPKNIPVRFFFFSLLILLRNGKGPSGLSIRNGKAFYPI